jgi:ribosomal protein S18 acetylase RimI-like enzyme
MEPFDEFWTLYETSFPEDERRDRLSQRLLLENPRYRLIPYYKDDRMLAFLSLWNLNEFVFIEHFAVKENFRGNGYGSKIINSIKEQFGKKMVLEVEPPVDVVKKKRIKFYERLGFQLNDCHYIQPPYSKQQKALRMRLMSYPIPIPADKVSNVVKNIYTYVYNKQKTG